MNLLLAVSLVSGAVVAQTKEKIAEAITRLEGEHLDARAMEFLIDAGKPAVGPLLAVLETAHENPSDPKFGKALRTLRAMGPEAAEACPLVVRVLVDERLLYIGPGRRPVIAFTAVVPQAAAGVRGQFVIPKSTIDATRRPFLLGLVRRSNLIKTQDEGRGSIAALDGPDVFERQLAADLLGREHRDAIPQLVALLEDAEQPTRLTVAVKTSVVQVRCVQNFANAIVWDAASKAIARIDPDHPKAVRGLALMVQSADDPRDRVKAAAALGSHGDAAKDKVDVLLAALDSDDDRLVAEAATALGMISVANDAVVKRLRELTVDDRPAIAARAKAALRVLEKRGY